jgi:Fur family ferric uptake transcriptional regulator
MNMGGFHTVPERKNRAREAMPLLERLRRRGWRLTSQRRVVAEALAGEHVHLTADEVYERAVRRLPEISRATVYNTLNELSHLGEVREVNFGTGAKRYDPQTMHGHQHLICERCGLTRDVHPLGEEGLALPETQRHGFKLERMDVVFWGICSKCAGIDARA